MIYAYDGNGRLTSVTDNLNRSTQLSYDSNGDLTTVTNTLELATSYSYSGTTHLLTESIDPSGRTIQETAYDAQGRAYRQWDGEDNLLVDIDYILPDKRTITLGNVVMPHTYDARNTIVNVEYACTDGTAGCGTGSNISYDGSFRQNVVVDANDNDVNMVWSADGSSLESVTDALGNTTALSYDSTNNLTQVINAQDNATFPTFLTSMTDALDKTTIYTPTTVADGIAGLLKQTEDPNGVLTSYEYNAFGQLIKTTQAPGTADVLTTAYGYDTVGRLTTTQQSAGGSPESHTSLNVYDAGDRLIATIGNWTGNNPANWETDCDISAGARDSDVCTQYEYDDAGRVISNTNTLGQTSLTFYDDAGRSFLSVSNWDGTTYAQATATADLYNFTDPDPEHNLCSLAEYDSFGRVVTATNSLGHQSVTEYDSLGRVDRSITNWQDGVYSSGNPDADIVSSYEYDAVGNVTVTTDNLGRETRTFYDDLNRTEGTISNWDGIITLASCASQSTERDENICTQYQYDEVGNTIIVTDTLGRMTRTFYDDLNRAYATVNNWNPATLTTPASCVLSASNSNEENICSFTGYDDAGRTITSTNALNQTSLTVYDAANRPFLTVANWDGTSITSEANCSFPPATPDTNLCSVTSYDSLGRRSSSKDPMGDLTEFDYDGLGRVISSTRYLDSTPVIQSTTYDALGNRLTETNARGYSSTFTHDSLNRQVSATSAEGVVVTNTYNAAGWVITTTNSLGHQTVTAYDDLGRRISTTDAENNTTTIVYDGLGNQISITDPESVKTSYGYDELNRLVTVIENDVAGNNLTDETDVTTTYSYDALGNRILTINARGYTNTHVLYDTLNRPSIEIDALGNRITTTYNALGQTTVITDGNSAVTSYEYDGLNRVTDIDYLTDNETVSYSYDALGNRQTMTDSVGTTSYGYDDLNRLISVTDPFTGTVGYGYDLAGNRTQLTYPDGKVVTTTYDMDNRMTDVEDWDSGITNYGYDGAGRLITTTLPNSVQSVNSYDDANRLLNLTHTDTTSSTLLAEYEYQLDGLGNRELVTETVRLPEVISGTGIISLTIGSQVTVTSLTGNQTNVALAHNGNANDYLAVWQDNLNDVSDLYAQRLDSGGTPILTPTLVHSPTINSQQSSAVAFSTNDNRYLVVWQDGRDNANRPDVYGRIYDNSGQPIGAEFIIEAARRSYTTPDVVYDSDSGDFVVVWSRKTVTQSQEDIRAQFITISGTLGSSIDIAATTAKEYEPAIATDGQGNFLVVWRDNVGSSANLYAQRFTASGLTGSVITVTTAANLQDFPDVAYEPDSDQYLVVWEDDRTAPTKMYGQRINSDGTLTGSNVRLDNATTAISYPAVAAANGLFIIGWGDGDLYLRTMSNDGTLGNVETLSNQTDTQQDVVLATAVNNIMAVWESNEDGNGREIYSSFITVTNDTSTGGLGALQTTTIDYEYDPLYRLTNADYSGDITVNYTSPAPVRSSPPVWLWPASRRATCLPIVYNSQHGNL